MEDRRRLASSVGLAAAVAAAAGRLAIEGEQAIAAVGLVVIGGCLAGGIVPRHWWIGAIAGLGVPVAAWWAPAGDGPGAASAWIAPAVALAAAGLGAALQRHLRAP